MLSRAHLLLFLLLVGAFSPSFAVYTVTICGNSSSLGPASCTVPVATSTKDVPDVGNGVSKVQVIGASDGVSIATSTATPLAIPSGWTAPTGGSPYPTPPGTAGSPTTTYSSGTYSLSGYGSAASLCTAACNIAAAGTCGTGFAYNYGSIVGHAGASSCTCDRTCSQAGSTQQTGLSGGSFSSTATCPAGYTNSSGTCTLSNAALVPEPTDNHCGVYRSGNVLYSDTRDPDCGAGAGTAATHSNLGGSGTATVTAGSSGNSIQVHINTDGSVSVTSTNPNSAAPGTSIVKTVLTGIPDGTTGATTVGGAISSTVSGTGAAVDTTKPQENCGVSGQPECNTIIDEGSTNVTGATTAAGTLQTAMTGEVSTATTAQGTGDMSHYGTGKYTAPSDDSQKISIPVAGSDSCSEPFSMQVHSIDMAIPVCWVIQPLKPYIAWCLSLIAVLYAWSAYVKYSGDK